VLVVGILPDLAIAGASSAGRSPGEGGPARAMDHAANDILVEDMLSATQPAVSDWRVWGGATGLVLPRYDGASRYMFFPLPLVQIGYRDLVEMSVYDGLQINLIRDGAFRAGPLAKIDFTQRVPRETPSPIVGTFHTSLTGGAFAEYSFKTSVPTKFRAEVLQSFQPEQGMEAKFALLSELSLGKSISWEVGPLVRWANSLALKSRFEAPDLALATSSPPFRPAAGFASAGIESEMNWRVTPNVKVTTFGEYERLASRLSPSPAIKYGGSLNQFALGLSLAYRLIGP
jgi:outer membrane scaffolding protein for murein synthesis (MipA/OmpV family)